ncbi:iron-sulfur cluster carrier protein ApbC, partial [Vibrio cholerae]|nr:iron-sulfur cluster carrier protein ApbC [Vibrio cholerae]
MQSIQSKQDLCRWLSQFSHPDLISDWAMSPSIVTITPNQQVTIQLPFAA